MKKDMEQIIKDNWIYMESKEEDMIEIDKMEKRAIIVSIVPFNVNKHKQIIKTHPNIFKRFFNWLMKRKNEKISITSYEISEYRPYVFVSKWIMDIDYMLKKNDDVVKIPWNSSTEYFKKQHPECLIEEINSIFDKGYYSLFSNDIEDRYYITNNKEIFMTSFERNMKKAKGIYQKNWINKKESD